MDKNKLRQELGTKMDNAMKNLDNQFKGLRTGRASVNLLDPVQVEAYGSKMPLSQVGTVSTPDARSINVQVWDKSMVKAVEKAIAESNLGLNPVSDGQLVRMNLPVLTQERRKELVKLASGYSENSKIAIRNIRREGMEELKVLEKNKTIAEDQHHSLNDEIQKITDEYIGKIDTQFKNKEQEILTI